MHNLVTQKELSLLEDLLCAKVNVIKKARLYERTLTDPTLVEEIKKIANNHERRFNELLNVVKGD